MIERDGMHIKKIHRRLIVNLLFISHNSSNSLSVFVVVDHNLKMTMNISDVCSPIDLLSISQPVGLAFNKLEFNKMIASRKKTDTKCEPENFQLCCAVLNGLRVEFV